VRLPARSAGHAVAIGVFVKLVFAYSAANAACQQADSSPDCGSPAKVSRKRAYGPTEQCAACPAANDLTIGATILSKIYSVVMTVN
jgi:hypothetical protein